MATGKKEPNVSEDHGHLVINRYENEAIKIEATTDDDIVIEVIEIIVDEQGEQRPSVRLRISCPKDTKINRSTRTMSHSTYDYSPRKDRNSNGEG